MTTRRWLVLILVAAAVLLLVGRAVAGAYADYLWYNALGATALWQTRAVALTELRLGFGAAAGLFAFANLYAVRKSVVSLVLPRRLGNLEIGEEVPGRYLLATTIALALLLAIVLALPQDDWMGLVLARSGHMFGELDPYFGADLGFFVYWLPFESELWAWAFVVMIVVSITVILLYALTPSLRWQNGALYVSTYVRRHFTVLVGLLLLLLAWSFRLDMYSLLSNGSGPDGAFTYVDHRIGLPGDLLLALVTLGASLIVLWSGFAGRLRLAGISVLAVVAFSLVVRELAPEVVDHSGSDHARADREAPYLETRAGYTRRAYALDALSVGSDSSLRYATLAAALPAVSIWDPEALARAVDAGRSGGAPSVRIAWRAAPAGLLAEVVDAAPAGAPDRAPWTVARVVAAAADDRGAPVRVDETGAPTTDDEVLEAPLVYPGASTVAVVADSLSRTAGTPLERFGARLAHAWTWQNFRILTSELPQPRPTIVTHRDIRDRVSRFAPFFVEGRRVRPLLVGDSLFWTLDLYVASATYPLSWHAFILGEDRSYLHHAATAVVQAATGEVFVVPDSVLDPLAATWVHRLPSVFTSWNALPAGVRGRLAPPIDQLDAQAAAFGRFGVRGDTVPARHAPVVDGADSVLAGDDIPFMLPDHRTTALALPLIDDTDRLYGLILALGGARRGTVWLPLATPGARWSALIERLRSVDSAGTAAREGPLAHGRVREVPLATGIGFVQPTYRWHGGAVPSVNRFATLAGDTVRSMIPTSGASPTPGMAPPEHGVTARATAAALYQQMRDALRRSDWAAFGRAFDALGRVLVPSRLP